MSHTIVCPNVPGLLSKLSGRTLVVRTTRVEDLQGIERLATQRSRLLCVQVNAEEALTTLEIPDESLHIPTALYVPEVGDLYAFLTRLQRFQNSRFRIFLPVSSGISITYARVLSSLGVDVGLTFDLKSVADWEAVDDLMVYSVYGKADHAAIEPFESIVSNYSPEELSYFETAFFNNPTRYLHVDENERIAVHSRDFANGDFIAEGLDSLDTITESDAYVEALNRHRCFFQDDGTCASCEAWRICMGAFSAVCPATESCKRFLANLLEAAEYRFTERGQSAKWQP